jgi:hypothetical protein
LQCLYREFESEIIAGSITDAFGSISFAIDHFLNIADSCLVVPWHVVKNTATITEIIIYKAFQLAVEFCVMFEKFQRFFIFKIAFSGLWREFTQSIVGFSTFGLQSEFFSLKSKNIKKSVQSKTKSNSVNSYLVIVQN